MSFPELQPGTELAHYRLAGKIGAGGMGEVWKAVDTTLDREVAVKVLPASFAGDPDRLARFEREARLLASLNHPHIAAIYGLHEAAGMRFLAMEYVPGEDLAARLERGAVPLEEALAMAQKVAEGLEAAHARGVVHRDLKPANIRLDGPRVKILDFGLAKAVEAAGTGGDVTQSPTLTLAASRDGIILGTAAYMSPEQARGQGADRRADVWAFGVVLFEMLTGRRLFRGATVSDVLAAVLRADPDWEALPAATPPGVRRLLRRCLAREPERRLRDMGDALLELREAPAERAEETATAGFPPARRALALTALAAALGTLLVTLAVRPPAAPAPVRSLAVPEAGFHSRSRSSISPDGRMIAYSPIPDSEVGRSPLVIRDLAEYEPHEVSAGVGAANPFFSPDGAWLAYAAPDAVYRVSLAGGVPQMVLASSGWDATGTWAPGDTLILSRARLQGRAYNGLLAVPAAGGEPRVITRLGEGERIHRWPHVLPDGRGVLFMASTNSGYQVAYATLDGDGSHRPVLEDASTVQYVAQMGQLLFYRPSSQTVLAVPFDPDAAQVTGDPVTVVSDVMGDAEGGGGFAVAADGTLIYTSSAENDALLGRFNLVWVDRQGEKTPLLDAANWAQPRLSPDGTRLLVRRAASPNCDLWTYDLGRRALTRVTFTGDNHDPIWHPSGRTITFAVQDDGQREIASRAADGTGENRVLSSGESARSPGSWSADGRLLAFVEANARTGSDIWVLDAESGEEGPFLASRFQEDLPALSPDGRWLAYRSDESGRHEVYVRPYPGPGGRIQVSNDGGTDPLWGRNGRELFYSQGSRMMAVAIDVELRASPPRELFEGAYVWQRPGNFDVRPDGGAFVMVESGGTRQHPELRIVLNWFQELERLSAGSR